MNLPNKKIDKAKRLRRDLDSYLSALDTDEPFTGKDDVWHEKKVSPASDRESCRDYTQSFTAPERYYGSSLWPWYLRGPFSARLRNWYARRHPEIFGNDYGT